MLDSNLYYISAWMPIADSTNAYLQLKLDDTMALNSFLIKGRANNDQWITRLKVQYSLDGNNWSTYMQPYGTEYVSKVFIVFFFIKWITSLR